MVLEQRVMKWAAGGLKPVFCTTSTRICLPLGLRSSPELCQPVWHATLPTLRQACSWVLGLVLSVGWGVSEQPISSQSRPALQAGTVGLQGSLLL